MTDRLLWVIAKLIVILIRTTYTRENSFIVWSKDLNEIDKGLDNIYETLSQD